MPLDLSEKSPPTMNWLPFAHLDKLDLSKELRKHSSHWTVRDGAVYFSGGHKLQKANPATFEITVDECSFVARDDTHVFHGRRLQKSVDRKTFEYLGDRYYRDNRLAYCEFETSLKPLKGQGSENFKVLNCGYARDSSFGYFWGTPLRKCTSPMTLKVIKADDEQTMDYAIDNEFIYCEGAVLKDADLESWQQRSRGFSIDKNTVFHDANRLTRVDVHSWQHLSGCYSRDKKHVYSMARQLKKACPDRWKLIDQNYSSDGEHVYFCGRLIDGADARTFRVSSNGVASDRHGNFDRGARIGKD